jgi:hypothetical protein
VKVHELIEWLKTQNQEADVQVVTHTKGRGYEDQGGWANETDFTGEEIEYISGFTYLEGTPEEKVYPATLLLGRYND